MASINAQDLQDLFSIEERDTSSFIKTRKQEMYAHQVFIDEDVGEPRKYRELINALYMASEYDEFNFMINTTGGQANSTIAIIEAIKSTDANVRGIITGEAHSAGSLLALNCHEVVVTDSATMMIHTAQYGAGGSTSNVHAHVDFSTKMINKLLTDTYSGFLSTLELADVIKGVELWFDADQIRKRLEARQAFLADKLEKATKKLKRAPKELSKQP